MHFSYLSLLLLTPFTLAAPTGIISENKALTKRGPNFGGNCWVLRKPDGSTEYSNRYLGPKSEFRVGCMKAEREIRRKEFAETKKRLEDEARAVALNEEQLACFARPAAAEGADVTDGSGQKVLGGSDDAKVPAGAEQVIADRVLLAETRKAIKRCSESRAFDERAGWGVGMSTKRICKDEIGRLADVDVCLEKVGGYPGPYI